MKTFSKEKADAWRDHGRRFECMHNDQKLRKRLVAGNSVQFVMQCQKCGSAAAQPLARAKALEISGGTEPPPFDSTLSETWEEQKQASEKAIKERFGEQFWKKYDAYLLSNEWRARRESVLVRAGRICEGCRQQEATEVHHLTYAHLGEEFLFELVAICANCHSRLHEVTE